MGACIGWRPVSDYPPERGRTDTGRGGDTPPDKGIEHAEELNKKNFIAIYPGLLLSPGTKNGGSQFSFLEVIVLLFQWKMTGNDRLKYHQLSWKRAGPSVIL